MSNEQRFLENYLNDFSQLIKPNKKIIEKLILFKNKILEINKLEKKKNFSFWQWRKLCNFKSF